MLIPPGVLVTRRVAYRLAPPLRRLAREAQRNGEHLGPELTATLQAIDEAARAYEMEAADRLARMAEGSAGGTHGIPHQGAPANLCPMTAKQVAERLGCSPRNVTERARRGSLPGRLVGRSWVFDPLDVEEHLGP